MENILIALIALLTVFSVNAQTNNDEIIGIWTSEKGDTELKFFKKDKKYHAIIISLKETKKNIEVGDKVVLNLKYKPILKKYKDGEFHWGKNELDLEIKMINKNKLKMKMSKMFFSREVIWKRVKKQNKA